MRPCGAALAGPRERTKRNVFRPIYSGRGSSVGDPEQIMPDTCKCLCIYSRAQGVLCHANAGIWSKFGQFVSHCTVVWLSSA